MHWWGWGAENEANDAQKHFFLPEMPLIVSTVSISQCKSDLVFVVAGFLTTGIPQNRTACWLLPAQPLQQVGLLHCYV